jgi:serine/threonine protein kinase
MHLVLELADGGDLGRLIETMREHGTRFAEADVWRYVDQISSALLKCHSSRIMHRDIKPTNLFLTGSGDLKLGDLGLGRLLSSRSGQAESVVGTPYYMSSGTFVSRNICLN